MISKAFRFAVSGALESARTTRTNTDPANSGFRAHPSPQTRSFFLLFQICTFDKKKLFKLALANNKADDILLHFIKPPEIFLIDSSIPGQGQFNTGASLCSEASGRNVHSWLRSGDLRRLVKVQFFYSSVYLPII